MENIIDQTLFGLPVVLLLQIGIALFLAITFLQTGLDKVFNFQGNKNYFKEHFKDTLLESQIPFMFPVIVFLEVATGILWVVGLGPFLAGNVQIILIAAFLALVTFLSLYFGQRVGKDYEGASALVPYLLMTVIAILIFTL